MKRLWRNFWWAVWWCELIPLGRLAPWVLAQALGTRRYGRVGKEKS